MERKQSEADFANMVARMSRDGTIWAHKWSDMRMCPHCHTLLYKTENNVDYTIVVGNLAGLVECKQDPTSFRFADEEAGIRPGQRQWLNEWQMLNRHSWLFLEMGDGSAPKDRNAWMISWPYWLKVESLLEEAGKKSLAWKENRSSKSMNAINLLSIWQLQWVPTKGFAIPEKHPFWMIYKNQVTFQ